MNKLANAMAARQMLAELSTIDIHSTAYTTGGMERSVLVKMPKAMHHMVNSLARNQGGYNTDWIRAAIKEKLERDLTDIVLEGEQ